MNDEETRGNFIPEHLKSLANAGFQAKPPPRQEAKQMQKKFDLILLLSHFLPLCISEMYIWAVLN